MDLSNLLVSIGVNLTSDIIYDFVTNLFNKKESIDIAELKEGLTRFINIQGADIYAEKIINFFAEKGDIKISGTKVFAKNEIFLGSKANTKFSIGNNSESSTDKTRITTQGNARITGQGGAGIRQNPDGSIEFIA